jgi:alpha-beta hydrolase superfamily lysophospholipase
VNLMPDLDFRSVGGPLLSADPRYPNLDTQTVADPLIQIGAFDREKSLTTQRVAYEDATHVTESWASMAAWTPSSASNQQVSGGRLFNNGATTSAGLSRALPTGVSTGAHFRAKTSIAITSGAASGGVTLFGLSSAAVNAFAANMVGIGFETDTLKPIGWGFGAGGGETFLNGGVALSAGTYWVDIIVDDAYVSFALISATHGTTEALFGVARSSFTPAQVATWNSDSRNLTGSSFGPVSYASNASVKSLPSFNPRTIEGNADSVSHVTGGDVGTAIIRVSVPKTYDSRKPSPLVIYFHGAGATELQMFTDAGQTVCQALNDAGYIVASSTGGGTDTWGNQTSLDAYAALYRYVRDRYSIGPVLLFGNSMGGLISLLLLSQSVVPGIAGWCGVYPSISLAGMFANPSFTAAIKTAYGINASGSDYDTKTLSRDPMLLLPSAFRRVPMLMFASASDTTVPKSQHSDRFAARLSQTARSISVVTATGAHGDASHYQPTATVNFFNACIAA